MRPRILSVLVALLLGIVEAFGSHQVIVRLENKKENKERKEIKEIVKFMGGRVLDQIPEKDLYLVELPDRLPEKARIAGVHSWETNRVVRKLNSVHGIIFNASNLTPQWYDGQPALTRIGRPAAELISTGRGVVVADINSGFDYAHPALAGSFTSGYDFVLGRPYTISPAALDQSDVAFLDQSDVAFLDQSDVAFLDAALSLAGVDSLTANYIHASGVTAVSGSQLGPQVNQSAYSHATLCAGIIHSIAPDSMIMPLRAFDDSGNTDLFSLAKAIDFAIANHAHVINMSFGLDADSDTVHNEILAAQAAGILIIASAGNANSSAPQYPAAYSGVLSVAATDNADLKATFSNYGTNVDVSAPGVNVISSFPGGYYAAISGTSFAAPIVAAEAALVLQLQKNPATVIPQSTVDINASNPYYAGALGTGRINLSQAVGGR